MSPRSNEDQDRYDRNTDGRISDLEKEIALLQNQMEYSITGGASREIQRIASQVEKLERRVDELESKTTRWEGGGYMLVAIGSILGLVIGWVANKLGLVKP